MMLSHGALVNMPFATLNTTSLMTASFHGHTEVVKLLLDAGAEVSAVDLQQSTSLGYCFGGGYQCFTCYLYLQIFVN